MGQENKLAPENMKKAAEEYYDHLAMANMLHDQEARHNEKWPRLAGRLLAVKRLPLEATAVNHMTREQDAVV
jgi:hypothetical protein